MKKRKGERTELWVSQHHRVKEKNKGQKTTETFWHLPSEKQDGLSTAWRQRHVLINLPSIFPYRSLNLRSLRDWGREKSVHISEIMGFLYKDRQSVLQCAALKRESDTFIRTQKHGKSLLGWIYIHNKKIILSFDTCPQNIAKIFTYNEECNRTPKNTASPYGLCVNSFFPRGHFTLFSPLKHVSWISWHSSVVSACLTLIYPSLV